MLTDKLIKIINGIKISETMKYSIDYDIFNRVFITTLLGGEFANCYGQGSTPEIAVKCLKIRIYQLRRTIQNN